MRTARNHNSVLRARLGAGLGGVPWTFLTRMRRALSERFTHIRRMFS